MKNFIVLMIFAIGLMVSLPSTSSGSGSPPDQGWQFSLRQAQGADQTKSVSFAVGQPSIDLPVMVANYEMTAGYELTFVSNQTFIMAVLPKEGGFVADQGLFLERQHLYLSYLNLKATDFTNYGLDFRLCRFTKPIESQIKNIESGSRCTIRADSQV